MQPRRQLLALDERSSGEAVVPDVGRREQGSENESVREEKRIRTLIADDQLIAREVLCRLLRSEPDVEVVGAAANGRETVEAVNRLQPDLLLLDVQMPELDGFGVLGHFDPSQRPVIIFVTASDHFALQAFDVEAVDYLVKPCTRHRLHAALGRAREEIRRNQAMQMQQHLSALLDHSRSHRKASDRITVKCNGRIVFLRVADIDWIEAADNYVELHVGQEVHLLRVTMASIEGRLPTERFLRISRSAIVNLDRIKELSPLFHGEYAVILRSGLRLTLTRGYRQKLGHLGWL